MIIAENCSERIAEDVSEPIMRETMTIIQDGKPVTVYKDDVEKSLYGSLYEALRIPFNYGA